MKSPLPTPNYRYLFIFKSQSIIDPGSTYNKQNIINNRYDTLYIFI